LKKLELEKYNTSIKMLNQKYNVDGSFLPLEGMQQKKLDYYFESYSHYGIHEEMIKDLDPHLYLQKRYYG